MGLDPAGNGAARRTLARVLPHEAAKPIGGMMRQGMDAMKRKLEADATALAE